ncbi:hypothetical protein [Thiothrix nivea]|uniref:Uncharacterized protein n=1 Tax=Thiothrix nivea (strain ATCC 35100 / DSM 5205 / JP2) TaxID=870187 RepID=A0A656HKL2_THINJ|nr:hypothetical protein [Thiothrix nivea]EIJ36056.1 hypothetical protein Thini_3550 [Thiothrix nivea DSM 5205]
MQRIVLELKILHKSLDSTIAEGVEQTAGYADQCGADEAHLVIFDRRPDVSWDEKIWQRQVNRGERSLGIWGM